MPTCIRLIEELLAGGVPLARAIDLVAKSYGLNPASLANAWHIVNQ